MKKFALLLAGVGLLALCAAPQVFAKATFQIINADGAGEGFNDPTPAAPVGGNAGTTIGQQRLIAFTFAANIWGCILDSDITIRVRAQFNPLTCNATSGTLGSTGANQIWANFAGAPIANTWFVDSEADALGGVDLNGPVTQDMNSQFNSNLGTATCLPTSPWYYGLDNLAPSGSIDLVTVLLHEFGHGLGFASTVSRTTGSLNGGIIDVYSRHLYDNTVGLHWDAMSNAQRLASITNTNNLVWDGPCVNANGSVGLCHEVRLQISAPAPIVGTYVAPLGSFSPCDPNVCGPLELVNDGVGTTSDACEPIPGSLAGKIAVLDRGTCTFVVKVKNAQNAGAIGVIVCNNAAGSPIEMGGADPTIVIPAVMVSQTDGNNIKANLVGATGCINTNFAAYSGADATGHLKMYAPNPSVAGSSTSHWDTSLRPNLLMEPNINADLSHTTDMTPCLLKDISWTFNSGPTALCHDLQIPGGATCDPQNVSAAQLDNGSFDPNGDALTMTLTPPGPYPSGHNAVVFTVSDGCVSSSCQADIFVDCPVPVKLANVRAGWDGVDALVHWEVTEAADHSGFNVYRADGTEKVKLNTSLLQGQDRYDFRDRRAPVAGALYYLGEVTRWGNENFYGPITLASTARPQALLNLATPSPNPFRFSTKIAYSLPGRTPVEVTLHDAQGRVVKHLSNGIQDVGQHEMYWDGRNDNGTAAPAGIYFVKLQAAGQVLHQKVLLSR